MSRDLPPLTEEHRQAIRACRFSSPLVGRVRAIALTDSLDVARTLDPTAGLPPAAIAARPAQLSPPLATATGYKRTPDAAAYEWELVITHPDAVAFVCDLYDEQHTKPPRR